MDKKKSQKQTNIERNLKREMREDLGNVDLWVKHFDTYNRWRKLSILGNKTKNQLRKPFM
jgi:hypothetical protein